MTKIDGPLNVETTEARRRRVELWFAGIGSVAGLLGAVATVITALRG